MSDLAESAQSAAVSEEVLTRPGRALLAWMSEQEGIAALLGRAPVPGDDLAESKQRIEGARAALAARGSQSFNDGIVSLSDPMLDGVVDRTDIAAAMQGLKWRPAMVDLRQVLSFQKVIVIDGLEARVAGANDPAALKELCLPVTQPPPSMGVFSDNDGKGFTLSSNNPNLRLAGGHIGEAQVAQAPGAPALRVQAITFFVHMGASYLQIATYKGRSFVRDGYHRAAALLRAGIPIVPCLQVEAETFDQVGLVQGALSYETLYGDQPPMVRDFWDEGVSVGCLQPAVRKVVRIRGDEFVVPR